MKIHKLETDIKYFGSKLGYPICATTKYKIKKFRCFGFLCNDACVDCKQCLSILEKIK